LRPTAAAHAATVDPFVALAELLDRLPPAVLGVQLTGGWSLVRQ
jgi:hypothetical protein